MDSTQIAALGGFLVIYLLIVLVVAIITIVTAWKVYKKAGQPGWASIVPFYNMYVLVKISMKKTTMFWSLLATGILGGLFYSMYMSAVNQGETGNALFAFLGAVLMLAYGVLNIILMFKLAKSFGHGAGFGVGLWLLNFIFMCILAFGSSAYVGPEGVPAAAAQPTAQQ